MIYPVLLVAGLVGLAVMALLGFIHAPGHEGAGHHAGNGHVEAGGGAGHLHHGGGHAAPAHGHAHGHVDHGGADVHGAHHGGHGGHGQAAEGHGGHESGHAAETSPSAFFRLMPLISPVNWFSWAVGAGATGMVCRALAVPEPLRAILAVGGAVLFSVGVVRPAWGLIFSFASQPAGNLESCVMQTVEAVTGFDERGEGLVRVLIDGRTEDILARLSAEEIARGLRVRRGDRLLVEEINPHSNSCVVSRSWSGEKG